MFTQRGFLEVPFTPVVDGYVFPVNLDHMYFNKHVKPINLLLGVNKDEGAYFVVYSIDKFLENLYFNPEHFTESDYTVCTSSCLSLSPCRRCLHQYSSLLLFLQKLPVY